MAARDPWRKERLGAFVEWVDTHITGDEKGEAQLFLDRLFQAFGQKGLLEVGGHPEFRVRKISAHAKGTAYADYVWKPVVLIEMKKRGSDLRKHFRQAFDYWISLVPNRPRYTVLCNFDEFWIYDFNEVLDEPLDVLALSELPTRYGPLAFLFPTQEVPTFRVDRIAVTRAAADLLAECYGRLSSRADIGPKQAQRFILQVLISLFSEDIGLLPKYFVTQLLNDCSSSIEAFDLLGGLFRAMSTPGGAEGGRYKDIPYFNGGIFSEPAPVELEVDEVALLKRAAEYDWSTISPAIFGTIFQHSMRPEERHRYGGHYTSPVDIMKIVEPTISKPWRTAIAKARSVRTLRELQQRLQRFTVLDPACGSGNFLYLAYRELKRIESDLVQRIHELAPKRTKGHPEFSLVTTRQLFGLDIVPFAVELAKVTMTLGHKLAIDELHIDEQPLPLDNLDNNIKCVDALIETSGSDDVVVRTPWPRADVIIGNPPFLGAKRLKPERGDRYVTAVREAYPAVPHMADYCVYWLRKSHDQLRPCSPDDPLAGRAGLVGTQNIRNNQSRIGGLDHIAQDGVIVEAVDNQPWSGEANVHVSIVNWVKLPPPRIDIEGRVECIAPDALPPRLCAQLLIPTSRRLWHEVEAELPLFAKPGQGRGRTVVSVPGARGRARKDKSYELAYRECDHINSSLSDQADISVKRVLTCNQQPKRCLQGKIPGYEGFLLDAAARRRIEQDSADVVVPYLTGRELLDPFVIKRWAIDFRDLELERAAHYSLAFEHCKQHVLPAVSAAYEKARRAGSAMQTARREHLQRWWQFWNRRDQLNRELERLDRYVGCSRVTRRPVMAFLPSSICPSDLIQVFAFDDDYSFGVLQSTVHFEWFRTSSRLKVERDLRYSVRQVFETFPWPQAPTNDHVRAVAKAGVEVRRQRQRALSEVGGGLRDLYRQLELHGRSKLKAAHAALNDAVLDTYGFRKGGGVLSQILELNQEVAACLDRDESVTAPGVPADFPEPGELVTEDSMIAQEA